MIDIYLRAETEADIIAALPFARDVDGDGDGFWIDATRDFALCIIGPVTVTPGVYDDDGAEITPPVIDARFHANMRCTEAFAAKVPSAIRIDVDTPAIVWA